MLQKELGDIFQKESHNLCCGAMVTVTQVHISPDLGYAKIALSVFAPSADPKEIFATVQANTKQVRNLLGRRVKLQLRVIPELNFVLDDSLDYIEKIETLLKK
jgi:ribosome-binding factor A